MAKIGSRVDSDGTGKKGPRQAAAEIFGAAATSVRSDSGEAVKTGSGGVLRSRTEEEMEADNRGVSLEALRQDKAQGGLARRDFITKPLEHIGAIKTVEGEQEKLAKVQQERIQAERQARLEGDNARLTAELARREQEASDLKMAQAAQAEEMGHMAGLAASEAPVAGKPSKNTVKVAKGSNLWKIAKEGKPEGIGQQQYMAAIMLANGLKNPGMLKAGAVIELPNATDIATMDKKALASATRGLSESQRVASVKAPGKKTVSAGTSGAAEASPAALGVIVATPPQGSKQNPWKPGEMMTQAQAMEYAKNNAPAASVAVAAPVVPGVIVATPSQGPGSRQWMQGDVRSHEPSALAVDEAMTMARAMAASSDAKNRTTAAAQAGGSASEIKVAAAASKTVSAATGESKAEDGGMTYSFSDEITGGSTMGDKVARLKFKEKGKDGKVYSESFQEAEADVNSQIKKTDIAAKKTGVSQQAANKSTGPKTTL